MFTIAKADTPRFVFNDNAPSFGKNRVLVTFDVLEGEVHNSVDVDVFLDADDGATISEYKSWAIAKAKTILKAVLENIGAD